MYKTITSLFLQKLLEADRNSGIQPSKTFLKRGSILHKQAPET